MGRTGRGRDEMILTVTLNPAIDVGAVVPVLEPDRKMHCHDVAVNPGGGGINVARMAIRLGEASLAMALAGGSTGDRLLAMLVGEGVPAEIMPIRGDVRESFTAVEAASGRQYRFVLPGPTVSADELAAASARIVELASNTSLVVFSGSLPPGVSPADLAMLVTRIRGTGAEVIVDTSGEALQAAAGAGTVLMKPSLRELMVFSGRSLSTHAEIEMAARALLDLGPNRAVIVSLAAAGALLVEQGRSSTWVHAPQVRVVSTVGAGDGLVAGVAVSLERGNSMVDAACLGVAVGSATTLAQGTALCTRADVEALRPLVSASRPQGQ
jgi:6-phosphofructokinase 2